ncbi:hypothetical protein GCM10025856_00890 [Methylophaga marina]|uniref:Uncharacterized protein n=1 Tax=Methylophaga marina TaxID=45495 RepID=A0ABN0TU29_9GAMM|nr:hypothetical protein [Methylophaga marina]BDZ72370.1 hypothetical protein GCM10025856_00890 [Methylophaga marina]
MTSLVITTYAEIVERERFNLNQEVTHDNFKSLVCSIQLQKNEEKLASCQIQKKKSTCNHHFMNGYLVETKNGIEAMIGGNCGDIYFKLNETFTIQRNRLRNELELEALISSITKQLLTIDETRVNNLYKHSKTISKKIRLLRGSYPELAKKSLENMAKVKNATVSIEVDYDETDSNGKKIHNWTNENIGNIKGIYIWNYQDNIGHIISLINELKITLPIINADKKHGIKQLKKWSQILSSITEIDREIERAHTEYLSFMEPRNILMTTLLITNREKRLNIIEDHLENKDNLNPETILSNFENDIRKEFKNKNFKLVA